MDTDSIGFNCKGRNAILHANLYRPGYNNNYGRTATKSPEGRNYCDFAFRLPANLAKAGCNDYSWQMEFLHKAKARGLNIGNVVSWLGHVWLNAFGRFFGTIRLRLKARLLGVSLGRNVMAHGPVGLLRWPGGEISIGDNASFISSWRRATASALAWPCRLRVFGPGARIEIGEGAQLSGASITARSTTIRIGKGVLLAPNCVIVDSDFHAPWPPENRAEEPGYERDSGVVIGDYAWIGMGSIILKGVHIGEGAIIGAGSVVTRDVPPHCLAAGSPAIVRQSGALAKKDG